MAIPGTDVCKWPSWLQGPLFQMNPGLAAVCAARAAAAGNVAAVKRAGQEAVGGSAPQIAQQIQAHRAQQAPPGACCLLQFPGIAGVGKFCILSKSEARAMIFGLLLAGSALVTFVGVAVLVAAGFAESGAGSAAGGALETVGAGVAFIPGGQGAGLALGSAGAAARRGGSSSGARQSLERRRTARAAREREAQQQERRAGQARQREVREGSREARRVAGSPAQQRRAVTGRAPRQPKPEPRREQRPPEQHH